MQSQDPSLFTVRLGNSLVALGFIWLAVHAMALVMGLLYLATAFMIDLSLSDFVLEAFDNFLYAFATAIVPASYLYLTGRGLSLDIPLARFAFVAVTMGFATTFVMMSYDEALRWSCVSSGMIDCSPHRIALDRISMFARSVVIALPLAWLSYRVVREMDLALRYYSQHDASRTGRA